MTPARFHGLHDFLTATGSPRPPRRRYIVRATRLDGELDVLMATYDLAEAEACTRRAWVGYSDFRIDTE